MQGQIDPDMTVKLAEAAGQALWGSAYHTVTTPGGIKANHLKLLSRMALHTIEYAAGSLTSLLSPRLCSRGRTVKNHLLDAAQPVHLADGCCWHLG